MTSVAAIAVTTARRSSKNFVLCCSSVTQQTTYNSNSTRNPQDTPTHTLYSFASPFFLTSRIADADKKYTLKSNLTASQMSSAVNEEAEFAYGSGHINPSKAVNPGLVYDPEEDDYINFLCSEGLNETQIRLITGNNQTHCPLNKSGFSNSDLNYPSMALAVGPSGTFDAVFSRTVTNVGAPNSTYIAVLTRPEGQDMTIKVRPNVLLFDSLIQKLSFTVRVSGSIGLSGLMSASIIWDDGQHLVRSPIVVYNSS